MRGFAQQVRLAARVLAKRPGFTATAIFCLGLGIGAVTAVFSIVDAVLLRALPYRDPGEIVRIWNSLPGQGLSRVTLSPAEFLDYRDRASSFTQVAAIRPRLFNLTGQGDPELVVGVLVSANLFDLLGVDPALGRGFLSEEETPGNDQVAVLSHGLWQRRFGGDPDLVGTDILINDLPYTVVGVLPEGFYFGRKGRDLWMPYAMGRDALPPRAERRAYMVGRLATGVSQAQAQAEVTAIATRLRQEYPDFYLPESDYGVELVPLHEEVVGDIEGALKVIFAAVGLVLLISCTNVANLLLARAKTREREVALRLALGSGRRGLVRQFLAEGLVLSGLGAALGLLLAWGGIRAMLAMNPERIPRVEEVAISGGVLAFTLGVALVTGLAFGLVPAFRCSRGNFQEALKEGGEATSGTAPGHRLARSLLVVAEVALALVVLTGAALLVRSYWALQQVDIGFETEDILTMELFLPAARYTEDHQVAGFFQQVVERLEGLPEVRSAAAINAMPLGVVTWLGEVEAEDSLDGAGEMNPVLGYRMVSPGYFETLGISLVRGRDFTFQDHAEAPGVAVVDEAAAELLWPGEEALGQRLRLLQSEQAERWLRVVGVVGDVRHDGPEADPRPQVYVPSTQFPQLFMYLVARTTGADPLGMVPAARSVIREVDPKQAIFRVRSMEQALNQEISWRRFYTLVLAIFAAVALLLVLVGVYAVMAYSAAQRTREIGIRMALGAQARAVLGMVVGQGLALAAVGVVLGLVGMGVAVGTAATLDAGGTLAQMLYGVSLGDLPTWITLITAASLLLGLAILASYLPARRAARVDPKVALRYE